MTKTINGKVSIYRNSRDITGDVITISKALDRIKDGKSRETVEKIRSAKTKEEADEIKKTLPGVCFSGRFSKRADGSLMEHSGYVVLDFDKVPDAEQKKKELALSKYVLAAWISPSGNGVKALVEIEWESKHAEHFDALMQEFPDADKTGRNVSRLCFESFDPNILMNHQALAFDKLPVSDRVENRRQHTEQITVTDDDKIFNNLLTWMASRGDAFREGERNHFVFKLAASCCRFGMLEETCYNMMMTYVVPDASFSQKECRNAVRSAYRANKSQWNTAEFTNEKLVTRTTKREIDIIRSRGYVFWVNHKNVLADHFVHLHVRFVWRSPWVVRSAVAPKIYLYKIVVKLLRRKFFRREYGHLFAKNNHSEDHFPLHKCRFPVVSYS